MKRVLPAALAWALSWAGAPLRAANTLSAAPQTRSSVPLYAQVDPAWRLPLGSVVAQLPSGAPPRIAGIVDALRRVDYGQAGADLSAAAPAIPVLTQVFEYAPQDLAAQEGSRLEQEKIDHFLLALEDAADLVDSRASQLMLDAWAFARAHRQASPKLPPGQANPIAQLKELLALYPFWLRPETLEAAAKADVEIHSFLSAIQEARVHAAMRKEAPDRGDGNPANGPEDSPPARSIPIIFTPSFAAGVRKLDMPWDEFNKDLRMLVAQLRSVGVVQSQGNIKKLKGGLHGLHEFKWKHPQRRAIFLVHQGRIIFLKFIVRDHLDRVHYVLRGLRDSFLGGGGLILADDAELRAHLDPGLAAMAASPAPAGGSAPPAPLREKDIDALKPLP